jgi:hypothetical protein
MSRRVALVRKENSEEYIDPIIKVTNLGEPGTTLAVNSTLIMETTRTSETVVLTRATRRNILEYGILYNHCRESAKSLIIELIVK